MRDLVKVVSVREVWTSVRKAGITLHFWGVGENAAGTRSRRLPFFS